MNKNIFNINEQKSKIGFAHGFISITGAIVLGYLFMMLFSKFVPGDYGVKIIPSVVFTPIVISMFGLWLLFSKNTLQSVLKFVLLSIILFIILKVF